MEPLSGPKKIVPNPQGVHLRHLALHMGGRGGSSPSAVPSLGSSQPKVTLLTPLRQRGWGCTPKHPNPPSPVGPSSPGEAQISLPGRQQEVCLAPSMEQVTRALPQAPNPRRSNPPVWPRQLMAGIPFQPQTKLVAPCPAAGHPLPAGCPHPLSPPPALRLPKSPQWPRGGQG